MKRKEELKSFRELGVDALKEKVSSLEEELMRLRFRHSSGQLDNSAQLGNLRRSLARVKTLLKSDQQQNNQR